MPPLVAASRQPRDDKLGRALTPERDGKRPPDVAANSGPERISNSCINPPLVSADSTAAGKR